jgi:hypothetical protein
MQPRDALLVLQYENVRAEKMQQPPSKFTSFPEEIAWLALL